MGRKHGFFRPHLGRGFPQVASTTLREGGGVNLITNGTFDADVSGWTATGSGTPLVTWQAGRMRIENGSANVAGAYQTLTTVIGRTYRLSLRFPQNSIDAVTMKVSVRDGAAPNFNGTHVNQVALEGANLLSYTFTATGTTTTVAFYVNSGTSGYWVEVDDVSVL